MKHVVRLVSVMAIALLCRVPASAQTADEVIEKHLSALGGRDVLAKITSQVSTGSVVVSTQVGDLTGPVEISRKAPNKTRSIIRLDLSGLGGTEVVVDQRCDGKTAFMSNSMQGDRDVTGGQLQGMLNSTFPTPLLAYKDAGAKVELVGKDTAGDKPALHLLYTPKAGPAVHMFFDAESYQLVRTVAKMDIPEAGGEIEQRSDFSDFRKIDGMSLPFVVKVNSTIQTVTITLNKVEFNKALDDAVFARPTAK